MLLRTVLGEIVAEIAVAAEAGERRRDRASPDGRAGRAASAAVRDASAGAGRGGTDAPSAADGRDDRRSGAA